MTVQDTATVQLQDPMSLLQWLASNAEGFQRNSEKLRKESRERWTAYANHDRQVQTLNAQIEDKNSQITALQGQVEELEAQRHEQQKKKEMHAAEAKQLEERAQVPETAAADIQAAIPVLKQAIGNPNGNGQVPADPTADDPRINQSVANLIRIHDEDPAGEAGAA